MKKENLTRLASISALGAGVVGVTAQTAKADTILFFPTPKPITVGYAASAVSKGWSTWKIANTKLASALGAFRLFITQSVEALHARVSGSTRTIRNGVKIQGNTINTAKHPFAPSAPMFKFTNANSAKFAKSGAALWYANPAIPKAELTLGSKKQHQTRTSVVQPWVATHSTLLNKGAMSAVPPTPPTNTAQQYLLFEFQTSVGNPYIGWLDLKESWKTLPTGPNGEPVAWGYDETPIVPEPATAIPTGLAALALGAAGVRRWRRSRKAS